MSNHYQYKCTDCASTFDPGYIENGMIYLCPDCGSAEKNQPLKGVLTIKYNYETIKESVTERFAGAIDSGKIWLYPELWPIDFSAVNSIIQTRISLPGNQLLKYTIEGSELLLFDETRNPTNSFKDRASILVALKARELGVTSVAAASTGNAGSSLAGICSRLGLKSYIFVPRNIPEAKRIQIQSYGADICIVDGDYDQAFDLCLEIANANNWYNRNTAYNPLTIEGKKSAAYDIYYQSEGVLPEVILVPVGDGVIISGLFKGFNELKELELIREIPKLIAVQAEGSSAVVDFLTTDEFTYKSAHTIADSICAGAPRNLYMAVDAVRRSDGFGITVSDSEILTAQQELATKLGMLVESSSASTFAAYKEVISKYELSSKIMLLLTGSGLKDSKALETWNTVPEVLSTDEWKDRLVKG